MPISTALHSLDSLYLTELRDLYSAEKQLTKALPKMVEAASHSELKDAFRNHLQETREHVKRLEQVFDIMEEPPEEEHCEAMEGLLKEGEEIIEEQGEETIKDAALIAAAQRVEHYEIAGYGTVATYANELGWDEAGTLLHETLEEEKAADETLTGLATGGWLFEGINQEAEARS